LSEAAKFMKSVNTIIQQLREIPKAIEQSDERLDLRPSFRGAVSPAAGPISTDSSPHFDDSNWAIDNERLFEDVIAGIQSRVEGAAKVGADTGVEALAWYRSFHNYTKWGIVIPLSSLVCMESFYFNALPLPRHERLSLAFKALLAHETTHFAFDYACAWFELLLRAPVRRAFSSRMIGSIELPGAKIVEQYLEIEEAVANAVMLRAAATSERGPAIKALENFVLKQPAGYCDGVATVPETRFEVAIAEVFRSYLAPWALDHKLDLATPGLSLRRLLPLGDEAIGECPINVLPDLQSIGMPPDALRLMTCILQLEETDRFSKLLAKLPDEIQRDWERQKARIKLSLPSPPRFEKLKGFKDTYSLRLRSGIRVHLEPPPARSSTWRAVKVGSHKEMGHG
jgi:hypothetical protein